jgi:hypothetical protein
MKLERFAPGHYRVRGASHYAHIRHSLDRPRLWEVQIRENKTGTLVRYAGLWVNLTQAEAEAIHVLERM